MKRLISMVILLLSFTYVNAQGNSKNSKNDVVYMHNGGIIEGDVIRVSEFTVTFSYGGENAQQVVSKYAVDRIVYKSGRLESITPKVIVTSRDDWESVIILEDKSEVAGLKKVGEVVGKNGKWSVNTSDKADRISTKRMKEEAAELGCQFILLMSSSNVHSAYGETHSLRKGIAYKY